MSLRPRTCAPRPSAPSPGRRNISGRISRAPDRECRRCSRSRLAELAGFTTASIETRMFSTQLRRVEHAEDIDAPSPPAPRRFARHCRDSWCSRRRWSRAAASGSGGSASPRADRAAAPTGIPAGSAWRRRRSRRPSIRAEEVAAALRVGRRRLDHVVRAHAGRE